MNWFEKIIAFFTIKDSDAYCETIDKLNQIKKSISDVKVTIPGCDEPAQLILTDSKWTEISSKLGKNIRMIGLEFCNDYKITYNEINQGILYNHKHNKNHELIYLVSGELTVSIDDIDYHLNNTNRSVLIPKGCLHTISGEKATYVAYYSQELSLLNQATNQINLVNAFG